MTTQFHRARFVVESNMPDGAGVSFSNDYGVFRVAVAGRQVAFGNVQDASVDRDIDFPDGSLKVLPSNERGLPDRLVLTISLNGTKEPGPQEGDNPKFSIFLIGIIDENNGTVEAFPRSSEMAI